MIDFIFIDCSDFYEFYQTYILLINLSKYNISFYIKNNKM
jgi:hypothetical protein